jgi:hypothetical protein
MAVQKVVWLAGSWGYTLVRKLADQMAGWKAEYWVVLMVERTDIL